MPPCLRGRRFSRPPGADDQPASSGGAVERFVTGESQQVDAFLLHVDGVGPGGLGGINEEKQTMAADDLPHLAEREKRSAHVGGMVEDDQARIGTQGILHLPRL